MPLARLESAASAATEELPRGWKLKPGCEKLVVGGRLVGLEGPGVLRVAGRGLRFEDRSVLRGWNRSVSDRNRTDFHFLAGQIAPRVGRNSGREYSGYRQAGRPRYIAGQAQSLTRWRAASLGGGG